MPDGSVTGILGDLRAGVAGAEERLFDRVYDELRAMARPLVAGERKTGVAEGDSADLVHDAYARLGRQEFENRRHLFFAYARAMRQLLVERARRTRALKRGGGRPAAALDDTETVARPHVLDALQVAELLDRLGDAATREAEVVALRFFGGLSEAAIGEVLGVSERTVRADWSRARARLAAWLRPGRRPGQT